MLCSRYVPRLLHLGLVVFAVALLAGTIVEKARMRSEPARPAPAITTSGATVVDVARGVDAGTLASIVRLAADERVIAVDDQPVANDFAAGAAISDRSLASGTYLDLTVASVRGKRRVLVLLH